MNPRDCVQGVRLISGIISNHFSWPLRCMQTWVQGECCAVVLSHLMFAAVASKDGLYSSKTTVPVLLPRLLSSHLGYKQMCCSHGGSISERLLNVLWGMKHMAFVRENNSIAVTVEPITIVWTFFCVCVSCSTASRLQHNRIQICEWNWLNMPAHFPHCSSFWHKWLWTKGFSDFKKKLPPSYLLSLTNTLSTNTAVLVVFN